MIAYVMNCVFIFTKLTIVPNVVNVILFLSSDTVINWMYESWNVHLKWLFNNVFWSFKWINEGSDDVERDGNIFDCCKAVQTTDNE